jgi:arginine/ornithine N-succinyltransferase beta subunit
MFKFIKKDSLLFGIIIGLLGPLVGMLGFYYYRFHRLTIMEFIQYLGIEQRLITNMVSFSLLANAVIFTLYINNHIDKTAKGVFISTCIYAILVLVLKVWFV